MKRCSICVGSGEILGGGMMMQDCRNCHGTGYIQEQKEVKKMSTQDIDKRSKSYKNAIKSIQENHDCSFEDASKIFDEEFARL